MAGSIKAPYTKTSLYGNAVRAADETMKLVTTARKSGDLFTVQFQLAELTQAYEDVRAITESISALDFHKVLFDEDLQVALRTIRDAGSNDKGKNASEISTAAQRALKALEGLADAMHETEAAFDTKHLGHIEWKFYGSVEPNKRGAAVEYPSLADLIDAVSKLQKIVRDAAAEASGRGEDVDELLGSESDVAYRRRTAIEQLQAVAELDVRRGLFV